MCLWTCVLSGVYKWITDSRSRQIVAFGEVQAVCCIIWQLIYLLTPWSRVHLEKLTGLQLVKKFPSFYGNRRFITALTNARHLSLSWASPIQSTHPHPTSRRSILILSSHLRLGRPSDLVPSGFPTKTLYTTLPFPYALHAPPISFFLILIWQLTALLNKIPNSRPYRVLRNWFNS
jgi:hypothetical protein